MRILSSVLVFLASMISCAFGQIAAPTPDNLTVFKYDPGLGQSLDAWINNVGQRGRVLVLPPGNYDIREPVFINQFSLMGEHPFNPPTINLRGQGMMWAGQNPWSVANRKNYWSGSVLRTRPDGLPPASFDITETPASRQGWNWFRTLTITYEMDTPGGTVEPGGLFSVGPFWCWWHPGAPRGPELIITTTEKPFAPDTRIEHTLTWNRPVPAERLTLVWTIDLAAGKIRLACNGVDQGERTIPPNRFFPAHHNRRGILGEAQIESNEIRHRWAASRGTPPNRLIRKFEATAPTSTGTRSVFGFVVGSDGEAVIRSNEGTGPVIPVPNPNDTKLYSWVGGETQIRNIRISSDNRFRAGIRIGQVMGTCIFDTISFNNVNVCIRKLNGAISYTHTMNRLSSNNFDGFLNFDHGIIHGEDWKIGYPRYFGVWAGESNFMLRGFTATSTTKKIENSDLQFAFGFTAIGNGGSISIADGMWNDEQGVVASGAWLYAQGGSAWTSALRLSIENLAINCPRNDVPTYWFAAPPNGVPWGATPVAKIFATHWYGPNYKYDPRWVIQTPTPDVPLPPTNTAP